MTVPSALGACEVLIYGHDRHYFLLIFSVSTHFHKLKKFAILTPLPKQNSIYNRKFRKVVQVPKFFYFIWKFCKSFGICSVVFFREILQFIFFNVDGINCLFSCAGKVHWSSTITHTHTSSLYILVFSLISPSIFSAYCGIFSLPLFPFSSQCSC